MGCSNPFTKDTYMYT